MEEKLSENHKRYSEKVNFYKKFGYDVEEERKFILEKSYPLYGDIAEKVEQKKTQLLQVLPSPQIMMFNF